MGCGAFQMRLQGFVETASVFFVDAVQPQLRRRADFVGAQAQHRQPARRVVHLVAFKVPVPGTITRTGDGERITLFAGAQGRFGFLTGNRITDGARQQIGCDVALDEVILRAVADCGRRAFLVLDIGQDDDRHIGPDGLGAMQVFDAVAVGQIQIEQHHVVTPRAQPIEAGGEALTVFDTGTRQRRGRDLLAHQGRFNAVILNQKNAHVFAFHRQSAGAQGLGFMPIN